MFLSVQDIHERWSCGRTFVYQAIAEMEHRGWLRRMWVGRHQRIALESVQRWEAEHVDPPRNTVRSKVTKLRATRSKPVAATQRTAAERLALYRKAL